MALTLTVTDNANATGVTVALTGTAAAATVTAYRVSGDAGALAAFDSPATGTVPFSAAMGVLKGYWLFVARTAAEVAVVHGQASDGADAVATQTRDAIKARIELLALPNCREVAIHLIPDESNVEFPCVILTPWQAIETDEQAMSTLDDIGRATRVMLCWREDAIDHTALPLIDAWRQSIVRAFHNQQIPTPRTAVRCRVEYEAVADATLPKFQHVISEFVIRVTTREPRGLGA